jgi:hypothetical protein
MKKNTARRAMTAAILLLGLLLVAGCGLAAAPDADEPAAPRKPYGHRFEDWAEVGIPSEFALGCLERYDSKQPLTFDEAVKLAQDVASIFVDYSFVSSDAARPKCKKAKDGWEVTLCLKKRIGGGAVFVRMGEEGWIRELRVVSEPKDGCFRGSPVSKWQEAANRDTAERLGDGEQLKAALTALDCCRILSPHIDRLYVRNIQQSERGDWEVRVEENVFGCDNASWTIRLRGNLLTLDSFKQDF